MKRDCAGWQGVLGMDALGLSSNEESRGLHDHLNHCPDCRQDAADVRVAAAALRSVDPAQIDHLGLEPAGRDALCAVFGSGGDHVVPMPTPMPMPMQAPGLASDPPTVRRAVGGVGRRLVGVAAAVLTAAAAIVAAVMLAGSPGPTARTVALTGEKGVQASVLLTAESWGTRATLRESGQAAGQVLTVSMKTSSGRWWVAGSYRTAPGSGDLEVQLSCAVQSNRITDVWITDQTGRTVLNGRAGLKGRAGLNEYAG